MVLVRVLATPAAMQKVLVERLRETSLWRAGANGKPVTLCEPNFGPCLEARRNRGVCV